MVATRRRQDADLAGLGSPIKREGPLVVTRGVSAGGARVWAMIGGVVADGFEAVRAEFEANFRRRGELGAACAAYYRGALVVDLWGGYRDVGRRAPWEAQTLVLVYSTSKGL